MKADEKAGFVPGMRFRWLTAFYDPLFALLLPERVLRLSVVARVTAGPGARILDVGCGTGTLALWLARLCPSSRVTGVDPDPDILGIARRKAAAAGLAVEFLESPERTLPCADAEFEVVVSSMTFHHMPSKTKPEILREVHRVLKPGGMLLLQDFDRPIGMPAFVGFFVARCLEGFETTRDNWNGGLPRLMRESGFSGLNKCHQRNTWFGTITTHEAFKGERSG